MKRNTIRIFAALFAVIFACLALCSCNDSIAAKYAKYDSTGERYDCDLTQYVSIPSYMGVEIPDLIYEPTEKKIADTRIKKQVYFSEEYVVEDGVIEKYDLVDCDFVTKVEGLEYRSMCSASNSALRSMLIGIEEFDIPEIDAQMLGMKPGETKTIEFVFPEPYYRAPLLSGRNGEFTVTIDKIRRQNLAEYTDEFVNQYYGAADTAAYDSDIKAQLESDYGNYLEHYEVDMIWEYILDNTKMMKMPGDEFEEIWNDYLDSYKQEADEAGMYLDDYAVEKLGFEDSDAFYAEIDKSVMTACKEEMILYTIARCEGMTISVSEYEQALVEAAAELETQDIATCENYVKNKYGSLSAFKEMVLFNKVFTFIGDNATKINVEEYYANKAAGKYENVEVEVAKKLSTTEILVIVGIAVAVVLIAVVVILAVKAVSVKKNADKKAAERDALEELRRLRREQKAAKKKYYGKKKDSSEDSEDKEEASEE